MKKKYGEVFTPQFLITDMLNTLPKEVWCAPSLKWLDPCAGHGNFQHQIIERLLEGLQQQFSTREETLKHIHENMLYVAEIQENNTSVYTLTFYSDSKYNLNVFLGNFLEPAFDNQMKIWSIDKFDIIVSNPPYQKENKVSQRSTNNPLWHLFVHKSLDILNTGGYMVNVHPSGWRNVDGVFKNTGLKLKEKQILYLEIHDSLDGIRMFKAITRYDFYCLRNLPNNGFNTTIRCQDGSIEYVNLMDWEFIPNALFAQIKCLLVQTDKVKVLSTSRCHPSRPHMSKEKNGRFLYPCLQHITSRLEPGKTFYTSRQDLGFIGVPKVIFSDFGINSFVDATGEYGMCQHTAAIKDLPKNLVLIHKALQSEKFKQLMKYCDTAGIKDTPINRRVLALFCKNFWKDFI